MAVTSKELKKQLHALGIKTYKNKSGDAFVKKSDIKKVLSDWDDDEYDEEEEKESEPSEDDAFFSPTGSLGSKTSLTVDHKFIGEFDSDEEAEMALIDWVKENNYYPNVWYVSDHGDVTPYTLSETSKRKLNK